jgi:hypothetical protein
MKEHVMNTRLDTIATRQSKTRIRDLFFAGCVALAAAVSIFTVTTASHAASTSSAQVAQR